MIKLIRWLIFGDAHTHIWKIIGEGDFKFETMISNGQCTKYIQKCEICGKLKTFVAK